MTVCSVAELTIDANCAELLKTYTCQFLSPLSSLLSPLSSLLSPPYY